MVLQLSSINMRDWNSIWFIFYRSVRNDVFVIKFKENSQMENERNSFCWGLKSTVSRFGWVIVYGHLKINMLVVLFSKLFMRSRRVEGSWASSLLPLNQIKKKTAAKWSRRGKVFYITSQSGVAFYVAKETKSCLNWQLIDLSASRHCIVRSLSEQNLI